MALIFVEGVDRTGKSTLAGELAKRLDARDDGFSTQLIHHGPPPTGQRAVQAYIGPIRGYSPHRNHVVLDRAHVGEAVWPAYFGRDSKMSRAERALIELWLAAKGAVGVLATRDVAGIARAFKAAEERGEPEPLAPHHIEGAVADFEREFHRVLVPWRHYDHGVPMAGKVKQAEEIIVEATAQVSPSWDHKVSLAVGELLLPTA